MKPEYINRKYSIDVYDPSWVSQFESEAKVLKKIFGKHAIQILHIGSTAVPGMVGKPTIDILILMEYPFIADSYNEKMEAIGYTAKGEYVKQGARLFVKEKDNTILFNVHIFEQRDFHVNEMLEIRDYLRSHPDEVEKYSKLKKELFAKYADDYGEYRKQKDGYMKKLQNRAAEWFKDLAHQPQEAEKNAGSPRVLYKQLKELNPDLGEEQIRKIVKEKTKTIFDTPYINTWQEHTWPVHHADYCSFIGEAGKQELENLAPDHNGRKLWDEILNWTEDSDHGTGYDEQLEDKDWLWEYLPPHAPKSNSDPTCPLFLFQCKTCKKYIAFLDFD